MSEQVLVKMQGGPCQLCDAPDRSADVTIQGSVGRGGRNRPDDIRTIQSALKGQDATAGGPSVKLAVDGVSSPLTIAAIEKCRRRQLGWADGRVDPDGPTIHKLKGSGGVAVAAQRAGPIPPPAPTAEQNKAFIERVGGLLPRARRWVESAQLKLDMAGDYVRRGPANPKDPFPALHEIGKPQLGLIDKYVHGDKDARAAKLQDLNRVRRIYDAMQNVLTESLLQAPMFGWGVGYFQPDPGDGHSFKGSYDAFTFNGGWQRRRKDGKPRLARDDNYGVDGKLRQDTIFLVVGLLQGRSDDYVTEVILHELAHFVGPGGPSMAIASPIILTWEPLISGNQKTGPLCTRRTPMVTSPPSRRCPG